MNLFHKMKPFLNSVDCSLKFLASELFSDNFCRRGNLNIGLRLSICTSIMLRQHCVFRVKAADCAIRKEIQKKNTDVKQEFYIFSELYH